MSELYGAPSGIIAYNKDVQEGALAGMHSLKILGEIEQQPAERRLKEAHARLYESEADLKASQMRDIQTLQQLEAGVAQARAAGVDATVADVPKLTASPVRRSAAEPLEQLVQAGQKRGVATRLLLPYIKEAADLRAKESTQASAEVTRLEHEANTRIKNAERAGALAQAGMQGPEAYARMLLQAVNEGLPVDHLPQEFGPAALAALQDISLSSMNVKDQTNLELRQRKEKAQEKRWASANARDAASVQLAGARYNLTNERYQVLKKNGGEAAPEVVALREERRQASAAKREALERKEFPPIPLSQGAVKVDQAYTTRTGARVRAVEDPNGTIVNELGKKISLIQLSAPPKGGKRSAAAAVPAADDDDEDD